MAFKENATSCFCKQAEVQNICTNWKNFFFLQPRRCEVLGSCMRSIRKTLSWKKSGLINYHFMRKYTGNGSTAPKILNISTRLRLLFSFTFRLFYPQEWAYTERIRWELFGRISDLEVMAKHKFLTCCESIRGHPNSNRSMEWRHYALWREKNKRLLSTPCKI
jgi:hypothetical protein